MWFWQAWNTEGPKWSSVVTLEALPHLVFFLPELTLEHLAPAPGWLYFPNEPNTPTYPTAPAAPTYPLFHISLWLLNGKSKIIHPWELFTSTTVRKPAERLDTLLGNQGCGTWESKVFQNQTTSQSLSGRFSLTQTILDIRWTSSEGGEHFLVLRWTTPRLDDSCLWTKFLFILSLLRLSFKFISSNQSLNLITEASSQSPPHENPSWEQLPNQPLRPYSSRLYIWQWPSERQHAWWEGKWLGYSKKLNHSTNSTQESCSSDNYPKNTFLIIIELKWTHSENSPLPRKLRRWFNNNQLLRCITFQIGRRVPRNLWKVQFPQGGGAKETYSPSPPSLARVHSWGIWTWKPIQN